ncbi:arsenate reductase ArsC [Kiritimatiellaeota bacterium B1221]|nr:arsenate reductase ArsC [Kiritimatiellaeota bacterium B1221]
MVPLNILFLGDANACRSQMAEGWVKSLKAERLQAFSAGVEKQDLHPFAVKVMAEADVDLSVQRAQQLDELKDVPLDVVVTVCDHAKEKCPAFPDACKVVHMRFDDPVAQAKALAEAGGEEEAQLEVFRKVRDEIRVFVEGLPESLDA